jgi:hypothetical protein
LTLQGRLIRPALIRLQEKEKEIPAPAEPIAPATPSTASAPTTPPTPVVSPAPEAPGMSAKKPAAKSRPPEEKNQVTDELLPNLE